MTIGLYSHLTNLYSGVIYVRLCLSFCIHSEQLRKVSVISIMQFNKKIYYTTLTRRNQYHALHTANIHPSAVYSGPIAIM